MSKNYFIRMHEIESGPIKDRPTRGWENALVRQFAFFLTADAEALQAVCNLLLSGRSGMPVQLDRERAFQSGRPDLVVQLDTGGLLVIEAKVGASLGMDQLQRYMAIGEQEGREVVVALVSDRRQCIDATVLSNRAYSRPSHGRGEHFRWQHVHGILNPGSMRGIGLPEVRRQFAEYLSVLGLGSALFAAGWNELFGDREEETCRKAQRSFGAMLDGLASTPMSRLGRLHDNSHWGRRFDLAGMPLRHVYIEPVVPRIDLMLGEFESRFTEGAIAVRLVFEGVEEATLDACAKEIKDLLCSSGMDAWGVVRPHAVGGPKKRLRVDVVSALGRYHDGTGFDAGLILQGVSAAVELALNCLSRHRLVSFR